MSALPPKADIDRWVRNVRFCAISEHRRCRPISLQVGECCRRLNGASGRIIGLGHVLSPLLTWLPPGSSPFLDRCLFWASKFLNNFIRPMTRLFYSAHPPFGRLPKECGCWPVAVPRAAHPPRLAPKVQMSGSQRVPLLTGMNANGGADAGHKRRLENRLMVRRRERSRPAWPGSSKNFRVSVKVTINIAARLRASRQYQGPDLTGRRGSFTRSSLLFYYRSDSQG